MFVFRDGVIGGLVKSVYLYYKDWKWVRGGFLKENWVVVIRSGNEVR